MGEMLRISWRVVFCIVNYLILLQYTFEGMLFAKMLLTDKQDGAWREFACHNNTSIIYLRGSASSFELEPTFHQLTTVVRGLV